MIGDQKKWLPLARFLLVLLVLNFVYFQFYAPRAWFLPTHPLHSRLVHVLLYTLSHWSVALLNLFGYTSELSADMRTISMYDSSIGVNIYNYCLGIDILFVFSSLIISYPGTWRARAWFLPLGLIGIHVINLIRILAMCLWNIYQPPFWVDHHDLFNVVAAVFVFLMFTQWVRLSRRTAA